MGTQRFTAFAPAQVHALAESSRVVLDVRCIEVAPYADYSLCENLHMLAPMPKRWKIDMTLQVERIVQGDFGGQFVRVHWLRDPTERQCEVLGIPHQRGFAGGFAFTNGMPLRVEFDSCSDRHLRGLKLMVRYE